MKLLYIMQPSKFARILHILPFYTVIQFQNILNQIQTPGNRLAEREIYKNLIPVRNLHFSEIESSGTKS